MATPTGIDKGKGSGFTGVAIMAMAKVWLICFPVPPPSDPGVNAGEGVGGGFGRAPCLCDGLDLCGAFPCLDVDGCCGKGLILG